MYTSLAVEIFLVCKIVFFVCKKMGVVFDRPRGSLLYTAYACLWTGRCGEVLTAADEDIRPPIGRDTDFRFPVPDFRFLKFPKNRT